MSDCPQPHCPGAIVDFPTDNWNVEPFRACDRCGFSENHILGPAAVRENVGLKAEVERLRAEVEWLRAELTELGVCLHGYGSMDDCPDCRL